MCNLSILYNIDTTLFLYKDRAFGQKVKYIEIRNDKTFE